MTRRIRIHIGVGDVLETAGAVIACVAVGHLAGLWWALLLAAVILVVAGNLIYAQHRLTIPLLARRDFRIAKATVQRPFFRARLRAAGWLRARRARGK